MNLAAVLLAATTLTQANPAAELAGLWEAKLRFGPDLRGTLTVARDADTWRGEIGAFAASASVTGDAVAVHFGDQGRFIGRIDKSRARITGHWIQPRTVTSGNEFASPVTLTKSKNDLWRGQVVPLDDEFTMYLKITPRADGSVAAFLRNPERNLGRWIRIDSVQRDGEAVRFLGSGQPVVDGVYRDGVLSISIPRASGTYTFRRVEESDFYPRRRPSVPYSYRPPRLRDDGWPVASVEEVGMSREVITAFIQSVIDTPMNEARSVETHGVLIARHRKLVVEEYFHGEHADKAHDTRSAAKSLTATLVGAAIHAGVKLSPSDPVFGVMSARATDPRQEAMTLEHLLTMTSGFYCDDNDEKAPGNEENILSGNEPDYYKLALALPMESDPGTHVVYCSISPHLAGGVLQRVAGKPLTLLFHDLIAEPMEIEHYYMNLSPSGDAYMGGGVRFLPRDFMKLAQLHMDGGTWKGRRILSKEWAERATSPLVTLRKRGYGYLWYSDDRPYQGRSVTTFMAGGNGGQVAMGIPELDMVIGFWGGNYSDSTTYTSQNTYVPEILKAVVK